MGKLLGLGLGLALGVAIGATAVVLLSPQSGPALRENLRDSYRLAMDEARQAARNRRTQLEAELALMPRVPPKTT